MDHRLAFRLQGLKPLEIVETLRVERRELCQGQPAEGVPFLLQRVIQQVAVGGFAGEDIENGCSGRRSIKHMPLSVEFRLSQ